MTDPLTQLSQALAARAQTARQLVAAVKVSDVRHRTGSIWGPDLIVASEQSLPKRDAYEIVLPGGGASAKATPVGRDPGTNIALLKLDRSVTMPQVSNAEPELGSLALAFGADRSGGARARLGVVNLAGPEWHSRGGSRIDRRIVLDVGVGRSEEGGPVLNAEGARLGFSTFGPHGQVIVIPAATVDRIIPQLLQHGHVARGWLGVALQPVAVPDALHATAGQTSGLMVMSVAVDGPCAKAGVLAGDILLSVDGEPVRRFRRIAGGFGPDSVGREVELKFIRSGAVLSLKARITERPHA
jgi:S1-C subfamily serine protease